jgi:hypothetical protein
MTQAKDPNAIGNEGFLTEVDVRVFMRDNCPDANLLLDDYEFGHEEIRTAMTLAIDLWNETPPMLRNYTVDNFPYRYHLLMGTVANLLTMASILYRRNDLTYQIPGGAINDQNKWKSYDDLAAKLGKEYKDWVVKAKVAKNMESGWGTDWGAYRTNRPLDTDV